MIETLEAYLDINEIDRKENFLSVGEKIVGQPDIVLSNYSKRGWILQYFQQVVQGSMSAEDFFAVGDSSELPIYEERDWLQVCREIEEGGDLVLVDQESLDFFHTQTGSAYYSEGLCAL